MTAREIHEVFRDERVHVLRERCASCIFRAPKDGRILGLSPGRVTQMVRDSQGDPTGAGNIPCHSTIRRQDVRPAICRGFWDLPGRPALLELAWHEGIVEFDEPPAKES